MFAVAPPSQSRPGSLRSLPRLAWRAGRATWRGALALGLVARFTVIGASAALLVAGGLAWMIEARLTELMYEQIAARAVDQVRMGVAEHVSPADFERPHTPDKFADIKRRLDPHLGTLIDGRSGTIRLHLIAQDGTIVYSDAPGKQGYAIDVAASPKLADALAGRVGKKISTLSSSKTSELKARHDRALEVYVPFSLDGRVVGAYELYQDLAPVAPIPALVWGGVTGGFSLLDLALVAVVRGAAARIRRQQVEREQLIRRGEERLRSLVGNTSDVIAITDSDGTLRYHSPPAERVWGYAPPALDGADVLGLVHSEDREAARALLARVAADPTAEMTTELRACHADGAWREFEVVARNLADDPNVGGLVITFHDITERKQLERELKHLAFRDPLTGLPNRSLFTERLTHAVARARRRRRTAGVLFLDLDNFKLVNDTLGHVAGDRLLAAAAARLQACVRAEDTLARLGGDEFTVLMEEIAGPREATLLAERIAAALRAPFDIDGQEVFTATSIGIALTDLEAERADDLLRNADLAMYQAKAAGKDRYALFDPRMGEQVSARLALETALRRGIEQGELRLHYQPIMRLDTGAIGEVEALVRWEHPQRGLVPPLDFIPLAEQTGLIVPLGRWVLEEACRQVRSWQLERPSVRPLGLSVNLSPRQFQDPHLLSDIRAILERTGLDPRTLKLEITETLILEDTDSTLATVTELRALGIRLAVDDFGTGNSALSYLKRFPIDTLKIDKSFIDGLGLDREDTAIVHAVVAFAKALGVRVTAEGIETADQLGLLRELECDHGQGYYFAKPQPADAIAALLVEAGSMSEGDRALGDEAA